MPRRAQRRDRPKEFHRQPCGSCSLPTARELCGLMECGISFGFRWRLGEPRAPCRHGQAVVGQATAAPWSDARQRRLHEGSASCCKMRSQKAPSRTLMARVGPRGEINCWGVRCGAAEAETPVVKWQVGPAGGQAGQWVIWSSLDMLQQGQAMQHAAVVLGRGV